MDKIIFNILLVIIIIYIFFTSVEHLENTGPTDAIKEAVKQVYLADVESIRNLSIVAKKLQEDGGLVTPANMSIRGKLNIGSPSNVKDLPANVALSVENTTDTSIRLKTKADDTKNCSLKNTDGTFIIENKNSVPAFVMVPDGTITVKNSIITPGDLKASGAISGASINVSGEIKSNNVTTGNISATTINAQNITGLNTRNRARYIIVGNHKRPDLAHSAWTLIEIEVYDNNGTNIIKNKPVTIKHGKRLDGNQFGPELSNDGNIFTAPTNLGDNIQLGYHGEGGTTTIHALEYDLGSEMYIDQIVLHNRMNPELTRRLNGTTIELLNNNKVPLRIIQTGNWHGIYSKEYLL
jgi:uncharacterized protein YpmB